MHVSNCHKNDCVRCLFFKLPVVRLCGLLGKYIATYLQNICINSLCHIEKQVYTKFLVKW